MRALYVVSLMLLAGCGLYSSDAEIDARKRNTPCPAGATSCFNEQAPTISIEVRPARVTIGSGKFATITVTGTEYGAAFPDGMSPPPVVTTDLGSLGEFEEPIGEPVHQFEGNVTASSSQVKLFAPSHPGVASVSARITTGTGLTAIAIATVTFVEPEATTLLFSCRTSNIGVLADPSSDFAVACDASALDDLGHQVKAANIRFLAEAGTIIKSEDSSGDLPDYIYYPRQGERPRPKDVPPLVGEPSIIVGPETRNPRDMLATLVAYTEGNNIQTGDMFSGDPFVDMNDNQKRDEEEPFFSADGSNTYSTSQTLYIWKQVKVLWTGLVSKATCDTQASSPTDLDRSGPTAHTTLKYTLLDAYFNVLAACDLNDRVTWHLDPAGMLGFDFGQIPFSPLKLNALGMAINTRGNFPAATNDTSFSMNNSYSVELQNMRDVESVGDVPYTVGGTIRRTLTIDESGAPARAIDSESLPACGGTLH